MTDLLIRLFIKDHKNLKSPTVRAAYGTVAGAVGIVVNLLIAAVKLAVGLLAGSISVVADAVNNLSDAGGSLVTTVGFRLSGKPADRKHPFGHARIEYLTGLIVSFIVVMLGGTFLIESVDKIFNPTASEFSPVALIILGVSLLAKGWLGLFYRKVSKKIGSDSLKASAQDSVNDVISTAVVMLGAIISKSAGIVLDGYIGVAVALFILVSGIKLVIETADPLLGVPPEKETVAKLTEKILSYEGVLGMHDMIIHAYGANRTYCSVHVEVSDRQDIMVSHDIIDNIEEEIYNEMGIALVNHLDPVTVGDERIEERKVALQNILDGMAENLHFHDFRAVFGVTHDNILFDVLLPMDYPESDEKVTEAITKAFTDRYPTAVVKMKIDRDMTDSI